VVHSFIHGDSFAMQRELNFGNTARMMQIADERTMTQ
jgi:hypothetical protein